MLAIHARQIVEHGGSPGVRDEALLGSALARPQQLAAYGDPALDLADLAAALAYGLARNHALVDGNKRTAHVVYRTFLLINGTDLVTSDEEKYVAMMALAEGKLSAGEFAVWLWERLQPSTRREVHEPARRYQARTSRRREAPARRRAAR